MLAFQGTFHSIDEMRNGLGSVLEMLNLYTNNNNKNKRMRMWGETYWILHRTGPWVYRVPIWPCFRYTSNTLNYWLALKIKPANDMGLSKEAGNQEREYMKSLKSELHTLPDLESTPFSPQDAISKEMRFNTIERRGLINENIEV